MKSSFSPTSMQQKLGYEFKNPELLEQALTHPSLASETHRQSYERLEFLGDSVLGLMVTEMLWKRHVSENEGQLAKRRAALVCGEALAQVAGTIALGEELLMSDGEANTGGRQNPANLENALEALLGAVYLDGGLEAVRPIVQTHFLPLAEKMTGVPKDPKTTLQEWVQARGLPVPPYELVEKTGPAHAPNFVVSVSIEGHTAHGSGTSKRLAERDAASKLLLLFSHHD